MKTVVIGLSSFSLLVNCASILCYLPMVSGGEVLLSGDKHKKAGIVCQDCHKDGSPEGNIITAICFKCHIGYSKLAERTNKITPNPHESHIGYLECFACHHIHKLSEDYCGECHKFSFKVP
jgi:fumarate reductase flavoprotein subunit